MLVSTASDKREYKVSPNSSLKSLFGAKEIKCCSGAVYTKEYEGFIPKILTDFYSQRKAYKKEMMIAIEEKYELMDIYEKRFGKLE